MLPLKSPSTTYVIGQELVLGKHCWWVLVCDGEVCESKKEDFLDRTEVEGADLKVRCTSQGGPNHKMCLSLPQLLPGPATPFSAVGQLGPKAQDEGVLHLP